MSELKLLCGLWQCQGKTGEYLRGKTQHSFIVDAGHSVLIFPNGRRKSDRDPQFYLYSSPPREPGSGGNAAGQGSGTALQSGGKGDSPQGGGNAAPAKGETEF